MDGPRGGIGEAKRQMLMVLLLNYILASSKLRRKKG